ncbi:uncharacterized protein LOC130902908 [Diorhabda carinulata]|uniref:uncharacterized protein LOC130902908 n=1 Tax=Diorhabda carinulata TaxID=1163345 RepID=UPI0025A2EA60|nr:uncharacterized protein LOC130902908 [Diorhabda carinulata]
MYLATTSRPDISYAVTYLSRFLDRVTEETWTAGKRVLRYLQGTKTLGLTYTKHTNGDVILEGYSDADWATDKESRKSVSGSIILYGNNPISWSSKKQTCVALLTAKAEYVAAAQTAQDLINVKALVINLTTEILLAEEQSQSECRGKASPSSSGFEDNFANEEVR